MSGTIGDNVYRASGVVATAAAGGGVSWQAVVTASTLTAVAGNGYPINTTSNACTVTLPTSASVGDEIIFTDYARTWGTNALTISSSLNYQGSSAIDPVYDTTGESVHIVYVDVTQGWVPTYDGAVAYETAANYTTEWLSIAGGGGGSGGYSGGGGAGGYRLKFNSENSGGGTDTESVITLTGGTVYTAGVGAGGAGASPNCCGTDGGDSTISGSGLTTLTSVGGGGGGRNVAPSVPGGDGGSGGGGGAGSHAGGSGTANQGYDGGTGASGCGNGGAGGGGASAVGASPPGSSRAGGNGGAGVTSCITGTPTGRGGGGGGGDYASTTGLGTCGGGNGGAQGGSPASTAGTANTGGGGGAGNPGSAGGKGIIVLRMADGNYSGTTTGCPTVATDVGGSGETTITFNTCGTYTA